MVKTIKTALLNSLLTFLYIILVSSFMFFMNHNFHDTPDNFLAPVTMLLLFVFSAALTGSLVFGRPILWYIDGKKKEALKLLSWTLLFLFIILIIVLFVLISLI